MSKHITDRTWVEIDLDHYHHNLNELKRYIPDGTDFLQIVKADAYGHSAWNIAIEAEKGGTVMLGVANTDEASILRYQGCDLPILVLSPINPNEINLVIKDNLIPAISDLETAVLLSEHACSENVNCKIHINIDTGMNRSGYRWDKAIDFITKVNELPNIEIEGLFSHFAGSENDESFTELQAERFTSIINKLNFKPKYIHQANSSAIVNTTLTNCNLVRLGILTFGVYTDESQKEHLDLKPVLSFKTRITQVHSALKGESIGYNRTYTTCRDTRYAILPLGYADGYDFLLSNSGQVEIDNLLYPIIGKISMDMIAIDVTDYKGTLIGKEVTLIGGKLEELRAENLVRKYNGLSYELLCQVGRRARRYFKKDGMIIDSAPLMRRGFYSHDFNNKSLNTIIESALRERLEGSEISEMLYKSILKDLFFRHDHDFSYKKNFEHIVEFFDDDEKDGYYRIETGLTFKKTLLHHELVVVCTEKETDLQKYFLSPEVVYRWFLDEGLAIDEESFKLLEVSVNGVRLNPELVSGLGENKYICKHDNLNDMIGQEVEFLVKTSTYYPKSHKQFSVYIAELTQGVKTILRFKGKCEEMEVVTVFSGQNRYPEIKKTMDEIEVSTETDDWIFPTSGLIFVYN